MADLRESLKKNAYAEMTFYRNDKQVWWLGPIFGDAGSGYYVAVRALNLSLRIMDRMVETNLDVSFLTLSARGKADEETEMQNTARTVLKASMVHNIPREEF